MKTILITNDDGYKSYGLRALMKSCLNLGKIVVVAPEQPRSAAGLSITVHKPVRVNRVKAYDNLELYTVSGTTGDCVTIGLFYILDNLPDLVISGINIGENISLLEFFMSGTVAGAVLAAIHGVPSIAFSKREVGKDVLFINEIKKGYEDAARCANLIASYVLDEGLPEGIDFLNVNFPDRIRQDTKIRLTKLARLSLKSKVFVRKDPRGRPYYWIWGEKYTSFPDGTDAHEIVDNNNISITPISLSGLSASPNGVPSSKLLYMEKYLNELLIEVVG